MKKQNFKIANIVLLTLLLIFNITACKKSNINELNNSSSHLSNNQALEKEVEHENSYTKSSSTIKSNENTHISNQSSEVTIDENSNNVKSNNELNISSKKNVSEVSGDKNHDNDNLDSALASSSDTNDESSLNNSSKIYKNNEDNKIYNSDSKHVTSKNTTQEFTKQSTTKVSKITNKTSSTTIQNTTSTTSSTNQEIKNKEIKIALTIDLKALKDNPDILPAPQQKLLVPSSGFLADKVILTVKDGSTVLDVLKQYLIAENIQFDIKNSAYVAGINNIYEFAAGPNSGWLYYINGSKADRGANNYKLSHADHIHWSYTIDYTSS